jgi:hypothetical protein
VFVAAASVSVTPDMTLYLADVQAPVTFEGNVYVPRPLRFEGMGQTSQQNTPTLAVILSNVDGQVGAYLDANDVVGRQATLLTLHIAPVGSVDAVDRVRLTIAAADWTWQEANVRVSLDIPLSEIVPRTLYSAETEPGSPEGLRRGSIL